ETNKQDFILKIDPTFVPGSPIELELQVNSGRSGGMTVFPTFFTGARQRRPPPAGSSKGRPADRCQPVGPPCMAAARMSCLGRQRTHSAAPLRNERSIRTPPTARDLGRSPTRGGSACSVP